MGHNLSDLDNMGLMSSISLEFRKRIIQVSKSYKKARNAAFLKICFIEMIILLGYMITINLTRDITGSYYFLLLSIVIINFYTFKVNYRQLIGPKIYEKRLNGYLCMYSMKFDGEDVHIK